MKTNKLLLKILLFLCCFPITLFAQDASNMIPRQSAVKDTSRQTDLIDIAKDVLRINPKKTAATGEKKVYFLSFPFRVLYRAAPEAH